MEQNQVICTRLEEDLIEKIKVSPGFSNIADFIKKAVNNELKLQENFYSAIEKLENNAQNTQYISNSMNNTALKMQLLLEEISNQNKLLLKMYERISIAAELSVALLDGVNSGKEYRTNRVSFIKDNINKELETYQLTLPEA